MLQRITSLPVTRVSSQDLCETVTPEESTQNHPRINFTPMKRSSHWDGADRHGHPRTIEEAGAHKQHHDPFSSQGSVRQTALAYIVRFCSKLFPTNWVSVSENHSSDVSSTKQRVYSHFMSCVHLHLDKCKCSYWQVNILTEMVFDVLVW